MASHRAKADQLQLHQHTIGDGETDQVDHLVLVVYGIGPDNEKRVDDFGAVGRKLLTKHFKQSVDMGTIGRVEFLPVPWHKALHGDATGIDKKLKLITLPSVRKFREFLNDILLDVLLFESPIYSQTIVDTVGSELNRLYTMFCERNPSFSGRVSLCGHSLGSVILFDILRHQSPSADPSSTEPSPGTGQPSITYPQLAFKPNALFVMGSPIGLFNTVRGIDTSVDFELPTCKRVFNIFHPLDPVAYRLEPLIDPSLTHLRPVPIPHHKGRKRWNVDVQQGASAELKIPVGRLNQGQRIDYVLQKKHYYRFN